MRALVTADGAKQFLGWRDTQLNINCGFLTAGDGRTRCIPTFDSYAMYSPIGGYFADSACTQPLAYGVSTFLASCPATAVVRGDVNACSYTQRIYALGVEYMGATVYTSTAGVCTGSARSTTLRYYQVGVETPPTTWVEAVEQLVP